jgi:hypothetical protein
VITGPQIRAARALLGWTPRDLARRGCRQQTTVNLVEGAGALPSTSRERIAAIQATLETAGIEFQDGDAPGVRLHPKKRRGK